MSLQTLRSPQPQGIVDPDSPTALWSLRHRDASVPSGEVQVQSEAWTQS